MEQDETISADVLLYTVTVPSGGFRGARGGAPPWASKFFRFHAVFGKIWQNRMLAPPLGSWRPPWENPGSATGAREKEFMLFTCQNGHPRITKVILRGLRLKFARREVTIHGNLAIYHHNQWLNRFIYYTNCHNYSHFLS